MAQVPDLSRRKFLGALGATSMVRLPEHHSAKVVSTPGETATAANKVLGSAQAGSLEAIANQIIPPDQDPGAREAGAVRYIENILSGEQSEKLPLYCTGLKGIEQTSQLVFGKGFVQLSADQQIEILKSLEQGTAQGEVWRSYSSQEFFAMVWGHVLEGFYGPPQNGGNKDCVSWKMVGFPEHSGML